MKLYRCEKCGNIILIMKGTSAPVRCCGDTLKEISLNSTDAAVEKHVPIITMENSKVIVTISDVLHPMVEEHFIEYVVLETSEGYQYKKLTPNKEPKAEFVISDNETVVKAYAYCNLHGLWQSK